jgi:hopanoid C-2 methylase
VSAAPENPDFDYLHIGELGEATDHMIARIAATVAPPPRQIRYKSTHRLALSDFPQPAYH